MEKKSHGHRSSMRSAWYASNSRIYSMEYSFLEIGWSRGTCQTQQFLTESRQTQQFLTESRQTQQFLHRITPYPTVSYRTSPETKPRT